MLRQILLFPDPRPLVERLGTEFFRKAPETPGVYLMRDSADSVLYVGKAKNLRKRLNSYRVANPDRMHRRHLRLLRNVCRIELRECASESIALKTESELLLELRPRFNRAGTWRGRPRFLLWRIGALDVHLVVMAERESGWHAVGPLGGEAEIVLAALARLLWCAFHCHRRVSEMPQSWFRGLHARETQITRTSSAGCSPAELELSLETFLNGTREPFTNWIQARTAERTHPFEAAVLQADLDTITQFSERLGHSKYRSFDMDLPTTVPTGGPDNGATADLFSAL